METAGKEIKMDGLEQAHKQAKKASILFLVFLLTVILLGVTGYLIWALA